MSFPPARQSSGERVGANSKGAANKYSEVTCREIIAPGRGRINSSVSLYPRNQEAIKGDPSPGICVFRADAAGLPTEVMVKFINAHRVTYGVELICSVTPIAPLTYYTQKTRWAARVQRDA